MTLTKDDSPAVHESGHALMAVITGKTINYVTIVPKGISSGECNSDFKEGILEDKSKKAIDFKMDMTCLDYLAGITAENVVLGIEPEECSKHGQMDVLMMGKLVSLAFDDSTEADGYIKFMTQKVHEIIETPLAQRQIRAIAKELKDQKTLSGEQVADIMATHSA